MSEEQTCVWDQQAQAPTCISHEQPTAGGTQVLPYRELAKQEGLVSSYAFGKILKAGYAKDIHRKSKILEAQGYVYDTELSSPKVTVAFNRKNGHAIVVFKGTDPTNISDVWTDLHILGGAKPSQLSRVTHSREVIERARAKYGHGNVIAAGHSLGGYLAQHSGADHVMTFNKLSIGDENETLAEHQVDFRNRSDIASLLRDASAVVGEHQHEVELEGGKWYFPVATHRRFTPLLRADKNAHKRKGKNWLEQLAVVPARGLQLPVHVITSDAFANYVRHTAENTAVSSALSLGTAAGAAIGSVAGPLGASVGAAIGTYYGAKAGHAIRQGIETAYQQYQNPRKTVHRVKKKTKR